MTLLVHAVAKHAKQANGHVQREVEGLKGVDQMTDTAISAAALTQTEATKASSQEADAALLAWAGGLDFSGPLGSHYQARLGASLYKARITRHTATGSKWSTWWRPDDGGSGSDCDTLFDNLEEAQAACTRHAATGKWTPSQQEISASAKTD